MLELKVNVQIGVTPEVVGLVSAILNRQPAAVEAPAPAAAAASIEEQQPEAPAATGKRGRPRKSAAPAPETADPEPNPAPEETPAEEAVEDMPDSVFYPQEEDVRTAMHVARQRIEGEDYKDKPSDDLHRAVTDIFKEISQKISGQKKPSALPQELRQAFIDATATIQREVEGNLTYTLKQ